MSGSEVTIEVQNGIDVISLLVEDEQCAKPARNKQTTRVTEGFVAWTTSRKSFFARVNSRKNI